MELVFRQAVRRALPLRIGIGAVSSAGKTYTALVVAAGIAGDKGRVGIIDTESGRAEVYSDSPGIQKALPNGYDVLPLTPPFTPANYTQAVEAAEKAGITVLIIDSTSHEWSGQGGCCDIAENNKLGGMPNWGRAKLEHKRFLNRCLSSNLHIIFCFRAHDKVKIVKVMKNGREVSEFIPMGLTEETEKSLCYEMTVRLQLEEKTHIAIPLKVPEPLLHLFPGGKMLTKEDGIAIRQWNDTGGADNPIERVKARSRAAAEEGTAVYATFFGSLTTEQKKILTADPTHAANKATAEAADRELAEIVGGEECLNQSTK